MFLYQDLPAYFGPWSLFSAGNPSQDLLNLDFFASSSASTPTRGNFNLPSPLSPMADIALHNSLSHSAGTTPISQQSK